MRVIRSRLIVRGAHSPLSCAEPFVHHVHSLLVDAALTVSRKSDAMYESGAKYKLRNFRAMKIFVLRNESDEGSAVRRSKADPSLRSE
jgi:hypothetical protein